MKETILRRMVSVKSVVTVILTAVFAYLSLTGSIGGDRFLTIFSVVIAFYFGTQTAKGTEVN